jgi:hypothetical protein
MHAVRLISEKIVQQWQSEPSHYHTYIAGFLSREKRAIENNHAALGIYTKDKGTLVLVNDDFNPAKESQTIESINVVAGVCTITYTVTAYSIDVVRVQKHAEIVAAFEQAMLTYKAGYPESEFLTFSKQEQELLAYEADPITIGADPANLVPLVHGMATARGMLLSEYMIRIRAKVDLFAAAVGILTGKRHKFADQIDAAATVDDVLAVTWS